MSTITTVRGEISAQELGYTSMHERLNTSLDVFASVLARYGAPPMPAQMLALRTDNLAFLRDGAAIASPECATVGDVEFTVRELGSFREAGGNAICDASPIGLRGDVRDLLTASEKSNVHVVFATGLYVADVRPPQFADLDENDQYDFFLQEVTNGVDGTRIRPGILKCALSAPDPSAKLNPIELVTLRALGRVSTETGLSLHVHTAFPMAAAQVLESIDVALETGLHPERLLMMHMDSFLRLWDSLNNYMADTSAVRSISTDLQRKILDRGVNIGFDSWSSTTSILPDDYDRAKGLVELLPAGYGDRIVLGHDAITKAQGKSWGSYGFTRFPQFIPPLLSELGFGAEAFNQLVIDNPARILAH